SCNVDNVSALTVDSKRPTSPKVKSRSDWNTAQQWKSDRSGPTIHVERSVSAARRDYLPWGGVGINILIATYCTLHKLGGGKPFGNIKLFCRIPYRALHRA